MNPENNKPNAKDLAEAGPSKVKPRTSKELTSVERAAKNNTYPVIIKSEEKKLEKEIKSPEESKKHSIQIIKDKINETMKKKKQLFDAVKIGDINAVKILIKNGADVNWLGDNYESVLNYAVLLDEPEILHVLINAGAHINIQDNNGNAALHVALKNYKLNAVKILIKNGADVNLFDNNFDSVLNYAVLLDEPEILQELIDAGAQINNKDDRGNTPLHVAVKNDKLSATKALIQNGADINAKDIKALTPIDIAVIRDNEPEILHVLIKKKKEEDPEYILLDEKNELYQFKENNKYPNWVNNNELEELYYEKALIYHFFYKNATEFTTNYKVNSSRFKEMYSKINLILKKAKIKSCGNELILAIKNNQIYKVKKILNIGIDPNYLDKNKRTFLHYAALLDEPEILHVLINAGAHINIKDDQGNTPLHVAVKNDKLNIVKALIKNGADTNVENVGYFSPINVAVIWGNEPEILHELIKKKKEEEPEYILLDEKNELNQFKENNKYPNWVNNNKLKEIYSEKAKIYLKFYSDYPAITTVEKIKSSNYWKRYSELDQILLSAKKEIIKNEIKKLNEMLIFTIKNKKINAFLNLIEKEVNINYVDDYSFTPTHWAAKNNDLTYLNILKIRGADFEISDKNNNTAIYSAIDSNNFKGVEFFLSSGINLNHKNKNKLNPYEYSIKNSLNLKITEIIVDEMEKQDPNFVFLDGKREIYNYKNFNFLPYWIKNEEDKKNYIRRANLYIEQYPDEEEIIFVDKMKDNYIYNSLTKKLTESKKKWIIENKSQDAFRINEFISSYLLRGPVEGKHLLNYLKESANPNYLDKNNRSFLHWAVLLNNKSVLDAFVNNGAFINTIDKDGNTPLHMAALANRLISTNYLIEKGANYKVKNNFGYTPLDLLYFSKSSCNIYETIINKIKEIEPNFSHNPPQKTAKYTIKKMLNEIYQYKNIDKISSGFIEPFTSELKFKKPKFSWGKFKKARKNPFSKSKKSRRLNFRYKQNRNRQPNLENLPDTTKQKDIKKETSVLGQRTSIKNIAQKQKGQVSGSNDSSPKKSSPSKNRRTKTFQKIKKKKDELKKQNYKIEYELSQEELKNNFFLIIYLLFFNMLEESEKNNNLESIKKINEIMDYCFLIIKIIEKIKSVNNALNIRLIEKNFKNLEKINNSENTKQKEENLPFEEEKESNIDLNSLENLVRAKKIIEYNFLEKITNFNNEEESFLKTNLYYINDMIYYFYNMEILSEEIKFLEILSQDNINFLEKAEKINETPVLEEKKIDEILKETDNKLTELEVKKKDYSNYVNKYKFLLLNVFNFKLKFYKKDLINLNLSSIENVKNIEEKLNEYILKIKTFENFNFDYENFISFKKMIKLFFDNVEFEKLDPLKKIAMLNIYNYFKSNDIRGNEISKTDLKNIYDNTIKIIKIDTSIEMISKMKNILNKLFLNKTQFVEEDIENYESSIIEIKNTKPQNIIIPFENYNLTKYENLYTDFVNKIVYSINEANVEVYNSSSNTINASENKSQYCIFKYDNCEVEFTSINHAWIWDILQFRINEQISRNYSCFKNFPSTISTSENVINENIYTPKVDELKYNHNYQELPSYINQTYEKPSINWDKVKNTAYHFGWTAAGTATLTGFGFGLYRWWKTGKPENVVNSVKPPKEEEPLCEKVELIMRTVNLENVDNLSNLEKDLINSTDIQIEEENERI